MLQAGQAVGLDRWLGGHLEHDPTVRQVPLAGEVNPPHRPPTQLGDQVKPEEMGSRLQAGQFLQGPLLLGHLRSNLRSPPFARACRGTHDRTRPTRADLGQIGGSPA